MSNVQSSSSQPHLVAPRPPRPAQALPARVGRFRVKLVVCDWHRLFLEALTGALAGQGYVVEAAVTSPADAVHAVALHRPDVLLIEGAFPGGSSLPFVRQVLAAQPHTRVVVLSSDGSPALLAEALEAGVTGYVLKSDGVAEIARTADLVHRGQTCVDRSLLRRAREVAPRPAASRRPTDVLTAQELRVLHLLARGLATKQMVKELGISHSTVRTHVQNILAKLGVHSRLQAVALLDEAERPPATTPARVPAPRRARLTAPASAR